ncbi:uncharacterized protein At4g38062 [Amborella trichopoda]|uniref:Uncharacterized protein n=1 Tax=Amborella trichopoda TaxID=13333 RepID=U5CWS3_AMBTC|nr:uncharacterized protein At4g38062 [Amborella trichopoda]ERN14405.1 hypothetical protein AMTR_s00033p00237650 [Amborella trichopoda]|eukprot:XP_020528171.1 uncharacterized protein At4g38062 [Amborella trichopoda]
MEELLKELDETKAAMVKLKAEYHVKSDMSENLRKALEEQLNKFKETKIQMEKQSVELNRQSEQTEVARQMSKELRSRLTEKESALKCLNLSSDQLRNNLNQQFLCLERENRDLANSLEEANSLCRENELNVQALTEEVNSLKRALQISKKKCMEAELRSGVLSSEIKQMTSDLEAKTEALTEFSEIRRQNKEMREKLVEMERDLVKETSERVSAQKALENLRKRGDLINILERKNGDLAEKLKWKKEQFENLEEAHCKLQKEFQVEKKEWVAEKTSLLNEMGSLQTKLDLQNRVSEDLRSKLQMCHQALAHEESRRKLLQIQLDESKVGFESVVEEYQEATSKIETLNMERNKEIAELRGSLSMKESLLREMEIRKTHLEQENGELLGSIKELQEAQIAEAGQNGSSSSLKKRLKALEQVHWDCSKVLKAKEAEWNSQTQDLERELDECRCSLISSETEIQELQMELEVCYSSMLCFFEEKERLSTNLWVLESGLHENLAPSEVQALNSEKALKEELDRSAKDVERGSVVFDEKTMGDKGLETELQRSQEVIRELQIKMEAALSSRDECLVQLKQERESLGLILEAQRDLETRKTHLEQENNGLLRSLKELQEARLASIEFSESLSVLKQQFKDIEWNLKAKEAEWNCQREDLERKLSECHCNFVSREMQIQELQMEVEECHTSLLECLEEKDRVSMYLLILQSEMQRSQVQLIEQALKREKGLKEELEGITKDLERERLALGEKTRREKVLEIELESSQVFIRQLQRELETSISLRDESMARMRKEREMLSSIIDAQRGKLEIFNQKINILELKLSEYLTNGMLVLSELQNQTMNGTKSELDEDIGELELKLENLDQRINTFEHDEKKFSLELQTVMHNTEDRLARLLILTELDGQSTKGSISELEEEVGQLKLKLESEREESADKLRKQIEWFEGQLDNKSCIERG